MEYAGRSQVLSEGEQTLRALRGGLGGQGDAPSTHKVLFLKTGVWFVAFLAELKENRVHAVSSWGGWWSMSEIQARREEGCSVEGSTLEMRSGLMVPGAGSWA